MELVSDAPPLILLPGMAGDVRIFAAQQEWFPQLAVPEWIDPMPGESLDVYAQRMARVIDPGERCVLGGASFGGVVALAMMPYLDVAACVLIGSVRSPQELPYWPWIRLGARFGPERLRMLSGSGSQMAATLGSRRTARRLRRLSSPDADFQRWAICELLRWSGPKVDSDRIMQIHGGNDRVLPAARTRADVIVPHGDHALTLFQPTAVNRFLAEVVRTATATQAGQATTRLGWTGAGGIN